MTHEITLVWANNISDEPEAQGQRDYYECSCGWRSPRLYEGGQAAMEAHEKENA